MIGAGPRISERVMLKHDDCFAVSDRDGAMKPHQFAGDGLWVGDTRFLSDFRLRVDGREPEPVGLETGEGWARFDLVHGPLHISRLRYVDRGLHERITVGNTRGPASQAQLEVEAASDFAAMLAVRGIVPQPAGPRPAPYTNRLRTEPEGTKHELRLGPGDRFELQVDVIPGSAEWHVDFEDGLRSVMDVYPRWTADCMAVRTDNPALNELLERALADIRMLCNTYDTGIYPTGGLPWFAVPFGRDTLISSILLLPVNPEVARGVLRYQARHQGRRVDQDTEEEPGRILHEVRTGEVVEKGLWPHILYGTVDATALFLCALTGAERWTQDHQLVEELRANADAALEWCSSYGDSDGDGYIDYRGARARNQGWKDSDDSLTNTDGFDASRPAALCEVQAYLYQALVGMSQRRPELKTRAAGLKRRFNRDFWMPEEDFIAQALDSSKRQVAAITSNPGHCLWMGIVDKPQAARVVRRLMSPELFSGWGIRTLSDRAINYDPRSYHNGSVWPFDTALAAAGMRRYGFVSEAERTARVLVEAAMQFPLRRPPELFCGDARQPGVPPREYWNTCTPQLWSAAAMFSCVSSILGLDADQRGGRLRVWPVETELWSWLEVNGLHLAGHRIDLGVKGTQVRTGRLPRGVAVDLVQTG